jgi:hypothetical protein
VQKKHTKKLFYIFTLLNAGLTNALQSVGSLKAEISHSWKLQPMVVKKTIVDSYIKLVERYHTKKTVY